MPTPGMVLADNYRLESEIGRGGMGSVWRAKRLDLDADVAVKVLHGEALQRTDHLERFSREAKATASLTSPHVIRIIDFGVDAATQHAFLVMELLEGETLRQRLSRERQLAPLLVARVLTQVARALEQAHSLGIVHRDLKPGNIFLVRNADEELVKLLDFGIAKADEAADDLLLTQTGNVLGTPQYMSPEQLTSSKAVDHRSDLWSLAVIAYECLVGRRPFRGASAAELGMKISLGRSDPPSSVAAVPAGIDEWFARATEVDPERRFQSARELTRALQQLASAASVRETAAGPAEGRAAEVVVASEPALPPATLASPTSARTAASAALPAPTLDEGAEGLHTDAALATSNTNSGSAVSVSAAGVSRSTWRRWLMLAAGAFGTACVAAGAAALLRSAPEQGSQVGLPGMAGSKPRAASADVGRAAVAPADMMPPDVARGAAAPTAVLDEQRHALRPGGPPGARATPVPPAAAFPQAVLPQVALPQVALPQAALLAPPSGVALRPAAEPVAAEPAASAAAAEPSAAVGDQSAAVADQSAAAASKGASREQGARSGRKSASVKHNRAKVGSRQAAALRKPSATAGKPAQPAGTSPARKRNPLDAYDLQ